MKIFPVAVQPYTVRDALRQDYWGTLEKIAAIGYQGIELGLPPEGITAEEQLQRLNGMGLQIIGSHASFNSFDVDFNRLIGHMHKAGGKYIAISLMFDSKDDVLSKAAQLNQIGELCRAAGITFLYHNHDWEFRQYDGEYVLETIMRETDPQLVQLELDTYWVRKGGEDPAAYLAKWKGRCPLLHIKDMEPGEDQYFAEIGEGILDFPAIAQAAADAGTEWLVVEQDGSRRDPLESLAISYGHLERMNLIRTTAAR
ncbi:sugar phosphate isomerase/epimerase family protein [Paenibacillus protaetiae]|uniref:Sugar phosphate isomerase/epimerase n=1 Tax=Paenibacillus protaetiae TaxID=2509456 RepID=A0A4P6F1P9_9BACL|nr:sugar phosphate isomerase/epimerase [Paenibacillus protaetiae]QAY66977.1 sugar phosphate isomerase/epimerase [Paenibacillus protaetiae]